MATRQFKLLIAASLAALLVWSSGALAAANGSASANVCENMKLNAATRYFQCLIGAYRVANIHGGELTDSSVARCDANFRRAFERADALGGCDTPVNPSAIGYVIKARAKALALSITADMGGCTNLTVYDQFAVCQLGPGGNAVDLDSVIDAINSLGGNVDSNTTLYIQAWGGDGGPGNTNNGSRGGFGGYAQTITTTSAILTNYGTTTLYYFLGKNGSGGQNAGGDGGSATMITTNDLATEPANIGDTLLIAGGAGGGGAGRGKTSVCHEPQWNDEVLGALGGNGGAAIATLNVEALGPGAKGGEREGYNYSGYGGEGNAAGTGGGVNDADQHLNQGAATVGGNGIAPIGGVGGNHTDPQTGFANSSTVVTNAGGQGGNGEDDAGGGGGGGGWGAGGGGDGNVDPDTGVSPNTNCVTGGGGGGASLAVASTATCSAAPTSEPANPNGSQGYAQFVFDLGGCE